MDTLVTGGSGGIGREFVQICRGLGWKVDTPGRGRLDMSDEGAVGVYLLENPTPELAVFCHGTWYSKAADLRSPRDWCDQYQSRVVFPSVMIDYWIENEELAAVTMVASTRGFIGGIETGPYSMACAAQIAMMIGYAEGVKGTQFNVVCPGLTDTAMGKEVIATGGAAPDAIPQDPKVVAAAILDSVIGGESGKVFRVVDDEVSKAKWKFDHLA